MSEGIAYQNKDILFKILGQTYKEKSFAAYGIDLPPIRELLPTSLPKISANEKDIDNLFLLEDGTYAIVDYESEFKKLNKIKYLNYIARVMEKYKAILFENLSDHEIVKTYDVTRQYVHRLKKQLYLDLKEKYFKI